MTSFRISIDGYDFESGRFATRELAQLVLDKLIACGNAWPSYEGVVEVDEPVYSDFESWLEAEYGHYRTNQCGRQTYVALKQL